jgi:hypothetical protein
LRGKSQAYPVSPLLLHLLLSLDGMVLYTLHFRCCSCCWWLGPANQPPLRPSRPLLHKLKHR